MIEKNVFLKTFINLEAIKKAFEYAEISCASDTTNSINNPREQLKRFVQNICNTMQNEQQTENQLEIQGFRKEWNNQRNWLLNHVRKMSFLRLQKELPDFD
jgi:hypothetical protein